MKEKNQTIQQAAIFFLLGVGLLLYSVLQLRVEKVDRILSPYLFPLIISMVFVVSSIFLYKEEKRTKKKQKAEKRKDERTEIMEAESEESFGRSEALKSIQEGENKELIKVGIIFTGTLVYVLLIPVIRFLPASFLYLFGLFRFLGEKRILKGLALSGGTVLFLYLLFEKMLYVILP
ncbi:MAG: tripartite tricarboxylate transporter TctB family protein [Eubacteriales bacterium]|nr:tripartite tricarboxylate transporter TctB family protein [Eubacteriales bacterium]